MRGRKPIPTKLKLLKGNPGKRALPEDEATPAAVDGLPSPPPHLPDEAQREWYRTGAKLAALGLLTDIDLTAFAAYCCCWARWVQAEDALRTTGPIVKAPQSGVPIQNPYLAIANRAIDQMTKMLVEFGMTPSSRVRASTLRAKDTSSDDEFITRLARD